MRVIFTCGGTGGHISPAIAVAKEFQSRKPDCEILFVGADGGMECTMVPNHGFAIQTVTISNFQRKLTPKAMVHNLKSLSNILGSMTQAKKIIQDFHPDLIVGTGGYASYPTLRQGWKMGIPTAVHEANAVPGLTTKMVASFADAILVNFADARQGYKRRDAVKVVGMPVRDEFLYTKKEDARSQLNLDGRPYVVSCWGSLGAREMNKVMVDYMETAIKHSMPIQHTHATGSFGWRWMPDLVKQRGISVEETPGLSMVEFLYDMPIQMAAADLIISRAGAATIAEICASGTPCILIPSPNVTGDHQMKNAKILEQHGAAVILPEAECTGEKLFALTQEILQDPQRQAKMRKALAELAVVNSAQEIYNAVVTLTP